MKFHVKKEGMEHSILVVAVVQIDFPYYPMQYLSVSVVSVYVLYNVRVPTICNEREYIDV